MDHDSRLIRFAREILLPLAILMGAATLTGFTRLAWIATKNVFSSRQAAPQDITEEPHHRPD